MGITNQLIRALKNLIKDALGVFKQKKKRSRKIEPDVVPGSWKKPDAEKEVAPPVVIKNKLRIPGLKLFHRILATVMLLLNLIFSQFLLGSVGSGAQPMFLFFMLNAYFIFRYLWSSRKKEESR